MRAGPRNGTGFGAREGHVPAERRGGGGRGSWAVLRLRSGQGGALATMLAVGCLALSQAASPAPAVPLGAVKALFQQGSVGGGTSAMLQRWGEVQAKASTPHARMTDVEMELARDTVTESDVWQKIGQESSPIADVAAVLREHAIHDNGAGTWSPHTFARTSPIESDSSRWDEAVGGAKRQRNGETEVIRAEVKDLRCTIKEQQESLSSFRVLMEGALEAKEREVGKLRKRLEAASARCQDAERQLAEARGEGERLEKALEQQQSAMEDMAGMLQQANDSRDEKSARLRDLEGSLQVTQMKLEDSQKALEDVQRGRDEAMAMLSAARQQMGALVEEAKSLREKGFADTEQLALQTQRAQALKDSVTQLEVQRDALRRDVEDALGGVAIQKMAKMQEEIDRLSSVSQRLTAERELVDSERRRLHCEVQELRGNIRVVLRVRPLLGADERAGGQTLRFLGPQSPSGYGIELPVSGRRDPDGKPMRDASHRFVFDSLLEPDATQEQAFGEVSGLIKSVLQGYRVCVFAYGQTGSGKTFSMEGPPEGVGGEGPREHRGLILRAVDQVFEDARQLEERGWRLGVHVSFLEIYNEQLRDLLDSRFGFDKRMEVKADPATGQAAASNLVQMEVLDSRAVESLLKKASKARATAATDCNERSSRSHSIFTLKVNAVHEGSQQEWSGVLNLVDLAGSERVPLSGASGARLTETRSINKSLSCLGDVISALANKDSHVPYRNSRLTHLLQPCLGGSSKTLMLVNVSPAQQHLHETLCTLRFADKVSSCDLPTAQRSSRVKF